MAYLLTSLDKIQHNRIELKENSTCYRVNYHYPNDIKSVITANRGLLRQALQRASILSNEKYRGVRLDLGENNLNIKANNPEQEEAEETLEVEYDGPSMEIGFNVNYLLDALSAVDEDQVQLGLSDANSSCLIKGPTTKNAKFVVMPMRL